jgi:hypothetical protein
MTHRKWNLAAAMLAMAMLAIAVNGAVRAFHARVALRRASSQSWQLVSPEPKGQRLVPHMFDLR